MSDVLGDGADLQGRDRRGDAMGDLLSEGAQGRERSSAGTAVEQTADRLRSDAAGLAHDVKDRARSFAEQQKNRGAEQLESLASTAQHAADGIQDEAPEAARYIRQAADSVQRFSTNIRDRSLEDMVSDASDFARRQPLLVIGGAVLAGLALTRFLKSSSRSSSRSRELGGGDGYQ